MPWLVGYRLRVLMAVCATTLVSFKTLNPKAARVLS